VVSTAAAYAMADYGGLAKGQRHCS